VLQALEGRRPFGNGQVKEQFRDPDGPVVTGLDQARDDNAVQKHVIAARGEADELIGQ
jgi:hypothetical protein